jgi:hypothetical protein
MIQWLINFSTRCLLSSHDNWCSMVSGRAISSFISLKPSVHFRSCALLHFQLIIDGLQVRCSNACVRLMKPMLGRGLFKNIFHELNRQHCEVLWFASLNHWVTRCSSRASTIHSPGWSDWSQDGIYYLKKEKCALLIKGVLLGLHIVRNIGVKMVWLAIWWPATM